MTERLQWQQLTWQRPLDPARVADLLRAWAADGRSPLIALETRLGPGGPVHLLGYPAGASAAITTPLRAMTAASRRSADDIRRAPVRLAGRVRASTRHRPLRLGDPEVLTRALFAAGTRPGKGEQLVLQVLLGPRRVPLAVPNASPSSVVQPWWSIAWMGNGGALDGEKRAALRTKVSDHGYACTIRLGAAANDPARARSLLLGLFAALRVAEAPGLRLRLRREPAARLDRAARPVIWPLRLGVSELTPLTGWPLGEGELPGLGSSHPRRLAPPRGTTGSERSFAVSGAPGPPLELALPIKQALHHLHVVGPTGVGKSTLLANLICQDIAAGYNVVVIEPKGDLVRDVLARLPERRRADAVVLDPTDASPVGLNPLATFGRRPDLVADGLLSVFKQLHGKNVGPRSSDILYAGLLTLARRHDASLTMLPLLLTNPGFRRSLTTGLRDPLVLEPFWAGYERWSDAERATAIGPVMNKLRPLLRPGLRGVLGQRTPRFDVREIFTGSKLLLAPLQRGVIGAEAAELLGSVLVAELWQAIQARGSLPASQRRPVMIYIDEAQNYLRLPTDVADALAQARGYAVGFTLAHQYLGQLPRDLRAAVLANARSRIVFQTAHEDARIFEKGHSELSAADLTALGPYQLYASLFAGGQVQPYAFGISRPLPPATGSVDGVLALSRARHGRPLDEIEAGFANLLSPDPGHHGNSADFADPTGARNAPGHGGTSHGRPAQDAPTGRRRRSS